VLTFAATAALVWTPVPAHAEFFAAPFIGGIFGTKPDNPNSSTVFGADVGGLGGGLIGGELDFGYHSHVFGDTATVGSNYMFNVMADVLVAVPLVGRTGVRPFFSAGGGIIRSSIEAAHISQNDSAFSVGGGALGYFSKHYGLRGDIKYFRTINSNTSFLDETVGSLGYWRASIGLMLR